MTIKKKKKQQVDQESRDLVLETNIFHYPFHLDAGEHTCPFWVWSAPSGNWRYPRSCHEEKGRSWASTSPSSFEPILNTYATGNSLAVQWLGLSTFTAKGTDPVPGWGTKIWHEPCDQKEKNKKTKATLWCYSWIPQALCPRPSSFQVPTFWSQRKIHLQNKEIELYNWNKCCSKCLLMWYHVRYSNAVLFNIYELY